MSFVTFSKAHFPQPEASQYATTKRRFPRTKLVLSILREVPSLLEDSLHIKASRRESLAWKKKQALGIPELRLFHKHFRLSKFFGDTSGLTISQTRNFLQNLYISRLYTRCFMDHRSKRIDLNCGGSARTRTNTRKTVKSNGLLPPSTSSEFAFGFSGQLNAISSRSRSASLSRRRPSMSLQLQLPFHSFATTSLCQSGDTCYGPFTPHSQILHTPPCPPEIPRYTKRGTPKHSISPSWSTNTCLTPIFEASVSRTNCWMSPVAPPEAIQLHAPRRLSYSRTTGRKNSLTTPNCTDQTLPTVEKLLASPVTIKSSSCVPPSPAENDLYNKDPFFSVHASPTALKV